MHLFLIFRTEESLSVTDEFFILFLFLSNGNLDGWIYFIQMAECQILECVSVLFCQPNAPYVVSVLEKERKRKGKVKVKENDKNTSDIQGMITCEREREGMDEINLPFIPYVFSNLFGFPLHPLS